MRNLDNKGFTLIEVIAAVVILTILALLLIPNINSLLSRGREESYGSLNDSITTAAKEYVNDHRYDIQLNGTLVVGIGDRVISNSCIPVSILLEEGYLSPSGSDVDGEYILNPNDQNQKLNLEESCIEVSFHSSQKNYIFDEPNLSWQ